MDYNMILPIFMRYVHIVSVATVVGGLLFLPFCVLPAVKDLDQALREKVTQAVTRRFYRVLWVGVCGLIISGVYNWVQSAGLYKEMGPAGNALIGTKVLLALGVFVMVGLGSAGLVKPKACRMVNIHLVATIMLLAAILRHLRLEHLQSLAGGS